eukprot:352866-Chlamydomonas_euryale.AAC.2
MDLSWLQTNMRRVQFGLDAWVNPQEFCAMQEDQDKSVFANIMPYMVKLTGYDANGTAVHFASGFMYTTKADLIFTCSHIRNYFDSQQTEQPVAYFKATYASGGAEEDVQILTPPHPLYDLMLLRGNRRPATNFGAEHMATGDTVYVAGFPPESTQVCYSKGMIGSVSPAAMTVNAHADNGWSGGPVVNMRGRLVAVIYRVVGQSIKRPDAMSASRVHDFALLHNFPGLST